MRLILRLLGGLFLLAGIFMFLFSGLSAADAVEEGPETYEAGNGIEVVVEPSEAGNSETALNYSTGAFVLGGIFLLASFVVGDPRDAR